MRRLATVLTAVVLVVSPVPAAAEDVTVDTRDELLAALAGATAGDTVFVDGAASIDLTGYKRIVIPAGVTLASDRGQNGSPGALLYNTELDLGERETWAQFSPRGSGVRVTGLRLRGPDPEIRDNAYQYDNSRGIEAIEASDLTVDNSELSAWSHGAVYLADTIEARVTDNHLHHNRRTGLGYGVVLYNSSSAVIEFNRFEQNRHAIAGNGLRTQRYEARYNLVVDNARSHGFDMHGENEALDNGAPYAGDVIHINNNSFRSSAQPAIAVRGRPATGAWMDRNCFAHAGSSSAVRQLHFLGNFHVGANTYGTTTGNCHVQGTRRLVAWQVSSGGTGSWQSLAPYTFDVSELGFGDFDADGRTDVFRATGHRWYYSPAGQGGWVALAKSDATRHSLRFGDFDGNGRTDVFTASSGEWRFSPDGNGAWQTLNTSGYELAGLRFGDFDGDGRTDVFRTNGSQWFYSAGGRSAWTPLTGATMPVESLKFGDLDGDGRTDVFHTNGSEWSYSSGARTSWMPLARASCPSTSLAIADLTGDGKADVFGGRCGA